MLKINELYDMQKKLDNRIPYEGKDLKNKVLIKLTALRVEIGEMMNEWRYFKAWSKDRKPRRRKDVKCERCDGRGVILNEFSFNRRICEECTGTGFHYEYPLLEEYVDGLHFILSLGLDLETTAIHRAFSSYVPKLENWNIMKQVESTHDTISQLRLNYNHGLPLGESYVQLVNLYLGLGKMLEFSDGEIKEAYMSKNEVNHERQSTGY